MEIPRMVFCQLQDEGQSLMRAAMSQMNLSARAYHRTLKLARTIAVLAILDDICAIAFWTVKHDRFANHVPFISSVNSSRKCNRCMIEHFKRCFETQRFTRSEV